MNIPSQTLRTVEFLLAGRAIGCDRLVTFSEHVVGADVLPANENEVLPGMPRTLRASARRVRAIELRRLIKRAQRVEREMFG